MVKPATVDHGAIGDGKSRTGKHNLTLVQDTAKKPCAKSVEAKQPEVADDLDDMWDNVPV